MIYDCKENLTQYKGISENLDRAIEYLLQTDFSGMDAGRYPICGDEVFVMVQTPATVERTNARWESHKNYIDIQFLIEGIEHICFQNTSALEVSQPYDPQKDVAFYRDNGEGFFVGLVPDSFVVCFPTDAHMALVCGDKPQPIKKAVLKVKISR